MQQLSRSFDGREARGTDLGPPPPLALGPPARRAEPHGVRRLMVLDTEPLACEQDRLKEIGVLRMFVGGRETFGTDLDDIGPVAGTPLD